jgi:hypothetical protein
MTQNNEVIEPNFEGEEMRMPSEATPVIPVEKEKGILNGPIIVMLFLILVAILGGLYYWYTIVMSTPVVQPITDIRPTTEQNQEPETTTANAQTQAMDVVSTSDELSAIEADVASTDLTSIETDLNTMDTNVDAALSASASGTAQ